MGDHAAADDYTFGDFTFASFPSSNLNPTVNSHHPQIDGPKLAPISTNRSANHHLNAAVDDDDDEWGDFVSSPIRSNNQHQLSNANSHTQSKPLDPYAFHVNGNNSTESTQMKKKSGWEKLQGPLPLSLFGDVEEDQGEEEKRSSVNDPQGGSKTSSANLQNGSTKVGNDIITNLYSYNSSPQIKKENELVLNRQGSSFDSKVVSASENYSVSGLNEASKSSASVDVHKDLVNNDQKVNNEVKISFNSNGSVSNSNTDASSLDFAGWSSNFNGQSKSNKVENEGLGSDMSRLNSNQNASSSDFGGWSFDFNGINSGANLNSSFSNLNGVSAKSGNEELNGNGDDNVVVDDDEDDDDDGWEFKDAFSEAKTINGVNKVDQQTHEISNINTTPSGSQSGLNGAVDLFDFSDRSFDLFSMSNGVSSESVKVGVELDSDHVVQGAETKGHFGLFTADFPEIGLKKEVKVSAKVHDVSQLNAYTSPTSNGSSRAANLFDLSNESVDFFSMPNGPTSTPLEFKADFDTTPQNGFIDTKGEVDALSPEKDDDFGNFAVAFPETGQNLEINQPQSQVNATLSDGKDSAKEIKFESKKGALPLSLFGDDEVEVDNNLETEDVFVHSHSHVHGNSLTPTSAMSIDDLISNLYSQAQHNNPTTDKEINSDLINNGDDFDGVSWGFKDAFAQERTVNSMDTIEISGTTLIDPDVDDDDDDFDDGSWEFKDASAQGKSENENSVNSTMDIQTRAITSDLLIDADDFDGGWGFNDAFANQKPENDMSSNILEDAHQISSTNYVDFYSELKDELSFVIKSHLQKLKKAQNTTDLFGEDDITMKLDEEVQEMLHEVDQESIISQEVESTKDSSLDKFLEALQDHKFQILESEYGLRERISLAEKDLKAALELRKDVTKMLKIMKLGSKQDHLTYISIWSKIISVCVQELQTGANIWKQSLQRNVLNELLSQAQGKEFIQALGEIYRVALVVGASAKLYKPWTFEIFAESSHIYGLINECNNVWSNSGLGEALSDILHPETNNSIEALVESIQCIHDLDLLSLQDHVFTQQHSICRLSLLTAQSIPGMKVVVWDTEQYFVKLANLWGNLISSQPPIVPNLHFVG